MTPYDRHPYTSMAYWETHPDQLELVAHLLGLEPRPAPPARCRVLEVGCAAGGHLIPIAELHPESELLGIDLSATQIDEARAAVAALGLRNLELRHQDLVDFRDGRRFDYIIAHGVYSWVPRPVAGALLDLVAAHLAPGGVAMVSHYTLPGWYSRQLARETMLWHARDVEPDDQVTQARAFLELVVRSARRDPMRDLLEVELAGLRGQPDWLVRHEHLGEFSHACSFGELHAEIDRRGLAYLGDAELGTMVPHDLDANAQTMVAELAPDLVRREELLDLLRFRTMRMTILCRAGVRIDRALAALARLAATWPRSLPFDALPADAGRDLLQLVAAGRVRAQLSPARCVVPAGHRPLAAAHARLAAARGELVPNLRHENVKMGEPARRLLQRLDGTRDRAALEAELGAEMDVARLVSELAAKGLLLS
jgi:SAM-dependent methyltransferase